MIRTTTIATCDVAGCGYSRELRGCCNVAERLASEGWRQLISDAEDGFLVKRLICPMHAARAADKTPPEFSS